MKKTIIIMLYILSLFFLSACNNISQNDTTDLQAEFKISFSGTWYTGVVMKYVEEDYHIFYSILHFADNEEILSEAITIYKDDDIRYFKFIDDEWEEYFSDDEVQAITYDIFSFYQLDLAYFDPIENQEDDWLSDYDYVSKEAYQNEICSIFFSECDSDSDTWGTNELYITINDDLTTASALYLSFPSYEITYTIIQSDFTLPDEIKV